MQTDTPSTGAASVTALLSRMTERTNAETTEPAGAAVLPQYSR